jgi:hypothetical protein
MPTRGMSGCQGLGRTLRSTVMTDDGTLNIAACLFVFHESETKWKDALVLESGRIHLP